jgi:SNF2 family DNA or RNA helicase
MELFKKYLEFSGLEHKSYQYEGVQWCIQNELRDSTTNDFTTTNVSATNVSATNVRGGFIADEMGLGKTILMIGTFISHFVPKTLVVVPPVLLDQWYNQIYKTTGHRALIYHGPKRWSLNLANAIIVLTTYDMIASSKNNNKKSKNVERENLLYSISWDRIVFDEGHHLRNKNTLIYSGALTLKAKIRWIVSGTPIQNKIQDFYNLCGILGIPLSFCKNPENLQILARDFILKRTKKQVGLFVDMKDISLNQEFVSWENKREKELSQLIHSCLSFNKTTKLHLETGSGVINTEGFVNHLVLIMKARQCCILPKLMLSNKNKLPDDFTLGTSKLDSVVLKMVERKDNGNGKLVFCHFKEEIDELARRLLASGFKNVRILDGRLSISKRKEVLHSGAEVLILQIQTGCEGLNLQEHYSEIYFISPHWNPAVEDQAVARCHRLGQKKQVEVYKFMMSSFLNLNDDNTEDEKITESFSLDQYVTSVQERKRNISTFSTF